ncbi:MAG: type II toxin-antitoxin system toxin DNA ADP-ribosyl transferase DarT, partial [bacterium]
ENLQAILAKGGLVSDAAMIARGGPAVSIGMGSIKRLRLDLPVKCNPGDKVGEYVPFYFCPRSIMLFVLHCANHPELAYKGGQGPIVHLEVDLNETVAWAQNEKKRWAFSLSNAGAIYTEFRNSLDHLEEVNWPAVASTDFRNRDIKEGKQAEFLVRDSLPWHLVRRVGVHSAEVHGLVARILRDQSHKPAVEVLPAWYY